MSSKDPLTDKDYFLEWRPKKTSSQTQGIDDLNIQDEIVKNNYKIYNEFTPHFDTYLKRQQSYLLTNTISHYSEMASEEKVSQLDFKYIAVGKVEDYKGATKNFKDLTQNTPREFKLKAIPEHLDFGDAKLCTMMTKELLISNLIFKGSSGYNIEIANITTESSMIIIEHEDQYPIVIRPGRDYKLKVSIIPQLVEPIKTVIILRTRNLYKFMVLVKFNGINNDLNIQPIIIDKPYRVPPVINYSLKNNDEKNELMIKLMNTEIHSSSVKSEIFQIHSKVSSTGEELDCYKMLNDNR